MTEEPDADPVIVQALLDIATVWRFWGIVRHHDGRVIAGRAGDIRIFGTVMMRLDVPEPGGITTLIVNPAAIDDVLVTSEADVCGTAARETGGAGDHR